MGTIVFTGNIPSAFAPPVQGLTEDLEAALMSETARKNKLLYRKICSFDENGVVVDKYDEIVFDKINHGYKVKFEVTRK